MNSFLENTAQFLLENHPGNMEHICVVLPNRRAGLFLKMHLARNSSKPFFAPSVFSVEDFIFHLSAYRKIEPVNLLFEFFEVYQSLDESGSADFQEFTQWAEVVLQDFNELDLALADPHQLFSYLSESKALALWNPDNTPLTAFETRYLHFYQSLSEFYQNLQKRLDEIKLAYQGMAYRKLAQQAEKEDLKSPWMIHVFAGLNALTAAEEKILTGFSRLPGTRFLWDSDAYYLDDPKQEAGLFLRKNKKTFKLDSLQWTGDRLRNDAKDIYLVGVPKVVGQAKVAGTLLQELIEKKVDPDAISLVLNDESTLFPVLNSIPSIIKAFNVTMGLPLNHTPLYDLVMDFIRLNENALRFHRGKDTPIRFYFQDLLAIFRHPYIVRMFSGENGKGSGPGAGISSQNQVFYRPEDVLELLKEGSSENEDGAILFFPWGNSIDMALKGLRHLMKMLKQLFNGNMKEFHAVDMEYVFQFTRILLMIERMVRQYPVIHELEPFRRILETVVRGHSIPFRGEPLTGLQIMGMLETRALDFDYAILLSVNDDFIPGTGTTNSFIPFEIRRTFNLSTHRERNAVFAYHFYRFLQRANTVYLIYNTEPGELGGGDRSRFISQVAFELAEANPNIKLHQKIYSSTPEEKIVDDSITIPKTREILETLDSLTVSGFSASAVNSFRNCSLRFYFEHILGIQEEEEVEETIEVSTFGTVIHDVLDDLYRPYKGRNITVQDVARMKEEFGEVLRVTLSKRYPKGSLKYGKNLLILKVMESFLTRFFSWEMNRLKEMARFKEELVIQGLETKKTVNYTVKGEISKEIRLKGVFDRVEQLNSVSRIIDYKTGRVEPVDLKIRLWDDLLIPGKNDKLFQLLYYALIHSIDDPSVSGLEAGIISFRNLSQGIQQPVLPGEVSIHEAIPDFKEVLNRLFSEMFDPEKPFIQAEDQKVCSYCPFKSLCNR